MWVRSQYGALINLENAVAINPEAQWNDTWDVVAYMMTAGTPQEVDTRWTIATVRTKQEALNVISDLSRRLEGQNWTVI